MPFGPRDALRARLAVRKQVGVGGLLRGVHVDHAGGLAVHGFGGLGGDAERVEERAGRLRVLLVGVLLHNGEHGHESRRDNGSVLGRR